MMSIMRVRILGVLAWSVCHANAAFVHDPPINITELQSGSSAEVWIAALQQHASACVSALGGNGSCIPDCLAGASFHSRPPLWRRRILGSDALLTSGFGDANRSVVGGSGSALGGVLDYNTSLLPQHVVLHAAYLSSLVLQVIRARTLHADNGVDLQDLTTLATEAFSLVTNVTSVAGLTWASDMVTHAASVDVGSGNLQRSSSLLGDLHAKAEEVRATWVNPPSSQDRPSSALVQDAELAYFLGDYERSDRRYQGFIESWALILDNNRSFCSRCLRQRSAVRQFARRNDTTVGAAQQGSVDSCVVATGAEQQDYRCSSFKRVLLDRIQASMRTAAAVASDSSSALSSGAIGQLSPPASGLDGSGADDSLLLPGLLAGADHDRRMGRHSSAEDHLRSFNLLLSYFGRHRADRGGGNVTTAPLLAPDSVCATAGLGGSNRSTAGQVVRSASQRCLSAWSLLQARLLSSDRVSVVGGYAPLLAERGPLDTAASALAVGPGGSGGCAASTPALLPIMTAIARLDAGDVDGAVAVWRDQVLSADAQVFKFVGNRTALNISLPGGIGSSSSLHVPPHPYMAVPLYSYAALLDWAGNHSAAFKLQRTVRQLLEKTVNESTAERSMVHARSLHASGESLLAVGQPARAVRYFSSAYQSLTKALSGSVGNSSANASNLSSMDGRPVKVVHPLAATSAGMAALAAEDAALARFALGCTNGSSTTTVAQSAPAVADVTQPSDAIANLVCLEHAAVLAANASWSAYLTAATAWAAVDASEVDVGRNVDYHTFARRHALASFRVAAGDRLSILEAAVLQALLVGKAATSSAASSFGTLPSTIRPFTPASSPPSIGLSTALPVALSRALAAGGDFGAAMAVVKSVMPSAVQDALRQLQPLAATPPLAVGKSTAGNESAAAGRVDEATSGSAGLINSYHGWLTGVSALASSPSAPSVAAASSSSFSASSVSSLSVHRELLLLTAHASAVERMDANKGDGGSRERGRSRSMVKGLAEELERSQEGTLLAASAAGLAFRPRQVQALGQWYAKTGRISASAAAEGGEAGTAVAVKAANVIINPAAAGTGAGSSGGVAADVLAGGDASSSSSSLSSFTSGGVLSSLKSLLTQLVTIEPDQVQHHHHTGFSRPGSPLSAAAPTVWKPSTGDGTGAGGGSGTAANLPISKDKLERAKQQQQQQQAAASSPPAGSSSRQPVGRQQQQQPQGQPGRQHHAPIDPYSFDVYGEDGTGYFASPESARYAVEAHRAASMQQQQSQAAAIAAPSSPASAPQAPPATPPIAKQMQPVPAVLPVDTAAAAAASSSSSAGVRERAIHRISEYMLRYGMSLYGCRLGGDNNANSNNPGGSTAGGSVAVASPQAGAGTGGVSVACLYNPLPGAPANFASLFNPRGFEQPAKIEMLTPRGLRYLDILLREVVALDGAGYAWDLAVAAQPADVVGRSYAEVGLPIVVGKPIGGAATLPAAAAAAGGSAPDAGSTSGGGKAASKKKKGKGKKKQGGSATAATATAPATIDGPASTVDPLPLSSPSPSPPAAAAAAAMDSLLSWASSTVGDLVQRVHGGGGGSGAPVEAALNVNNNRNSNAIEVEGGGLPAAPAAQPGVNPAAAAAAVNGMAASA